MTALISRSAVLTASRLSNFAIQIFSPLIIVRILDVSDYGRYQEFMIYAMLFSTVCATAFDSSLTYFIPRFPRQDEVFVTQASLLTLGMSAVVIGALFAGKPLLLKITTFDFILPLASYVLFFANLNWLENYWIVHRKTSWVLYYSTLRLLLRMSVLLSVAYMTRDVLATIWSVVFVEGCRLLLAFGYLAKRRMFRAILKWPILIEQLRFSAPIGIAAFIQNMGRNVGKIFASAVLGPIALAHYAVGSYLQQLVFVLGSGIQDAVYPELVRAHDTPGGSLQLWRRVNVLNCAIFIPAFVLLLFYAELIVMTMFTSEYLPAAPIFSVFALLLIIRCFNSDVLLRSTGKTGFMIWGNLGALAVNVAIVLLLSRFLGIVGAAIAFIAAEVTVEVYNTFRARQALQVRIADFADWRSIFRIIIACGLAFPIPVGFELLPGPELMRMATASVLYYLLVLLLGYRLGVADIGRVGQWALSLLMGRLRS